MFTTSRYASQETRGFARKTATRRGEPFFARGKKTITELAAVARRLGEKNIFIVEERDGKPAEIVKIAISETGLWRWAGESEIL